MSTVPAPPNRGQGQWHQGLCRRFAGRRHLLGHLLLGRLAACRKGTPGVHRLGAGRRAAQRQHVGPSPPAGDLAAHLPAAHLGLLPQPVARLGHYLHAQGRVAPSLVGLGAHRRLGECRVVLAAATISVLFGVSTTSIAGNVRGLLSRRTDGIIFTSHGQALSYRGLFVSDATGKKVPARLQLRASSLELLVDDGEARYPLRMDPVSQTAAPSDPYAQGVLADQPSMYLRLNESGGSIAYDSSGNGNDGTYEPGVSFGTAGPLASYPTGAVEWGDPAGSEIVTQSGPALPSANSPRTVEFWSRTPDCQASEAVQYGNSSTTNGQFAVEVNAGNCQASQLVLSTAGQTASWALPTAWDNGAWH